MRLRPLITTIALLLAAIILVRVGVRSGVIPGGPISWAKTLWLHYAICAFLILPFWLWRQPILPGWARRAFLVTGLSFAVRSAIEVPLLAATRLWRCEHGIAHNLLTLALLGGFLWAGRSDRSAAGRWSFAAGAALGATLLCETANAWGFSQLVNPATGVYFADESSRFDRLNLQTWVMLAVLWASWAFLLARPPSPRHAD